MRAPGSDRTFLLIAASLAIVPAAFVYFAVEPVPMLVIPVALAIAPFPFRRGPLAHLIRLVAALGMFSFGAIGMMSVGVFFFPSALAFVVSALLAESSHPTHGPVA